MFIRSDIDWNLDENRLIMSEFNSKWVDLGRCNNFRLLVHQLVYLSLCRSAVCLSLPLLKEKNDQWRSHGRTRFGWNINVEVQSQIVNLGRCNNFILLVLQLVYICLFVCLLFVCLSVCLSVCLYFCPSVYLLNIYIHFFNKFNSLT